MWKPVFYLNLFSQVFIFTEKLEKMSKDLLLNISMRQSRLVNECERHDVNEIEPAS